MKKHILHDEIGNLLKSFNNAKAGISILLDPACSGKEHIPLFDSEHKSRSTRLCCIDAGIIKNGELLGLIEIEESGFLPTKICGKFLTSAFSTHLIRGSKVPPPVSISSSSFFVQIVDISSLEDKSSKPDQYNHIQSSIKKLITNSDFRIKEYTLFQVPRGPEHMDKIKKIIDYIAYKLA